VTLPTSSRREAKVFINYRREDAAGYAGRLYEWLSDRFGPDRVFMDISALRPGADFVQAIESEVAACGAVLVVIGRQWLTCAADGRRRLDDPQDFVRLEIASALSRDVLVIPVLVEGADVPREQELPDDLKPLARRHALEITDERWEYDAGRLIDTLEERLEKGSGGSFVRRRVKGTRHGLFEPKRYWRLFPVRLLAGLLLLSAALALQLRLAYRPEPVSLEETGMFSPALVRLGRERLTIEAPSLDPAEGLLLSHVANSGEIVDLGFERARLDGDTLMLFSNYNPPTSPAQIDYQTTKPDAGATGEPCHTFISVRTADVQKQPAALHFYQSGALGGDILRALELEATGAELLISVDTGTSDEGHDDAPGCAKMLKVAPDFVSPVSGDSSISVIAEAGSASHFSFNPATTKNDLWEGAEGFFQPFILGSEAAAPFHVRALKITSLDERGTDPSTLLGARRLDGEWLNVESLSVGSDSLQIRVSGVGFVKVNGEDYVDPLRRMRKHPLATILLAVVDAALLVWFMRLLFVRRQPLIR
jgi:TIR domain